MPNLELLDQVVAHVTEHPDEWNQGRWDDCVAGWAVKLSPRAELLGYAEARLDNDRITYVETAAKELLDLDDDQADRLFFYENDLDDIRTVRDELAEASAV